MKVRPTRDSVMESTKSMLMETFDLLEKAEADGITYEDRLVFERLEQFRELRAASDFRSRPDETHRKRQGCLSVEELRNALLRGISPGPDDAWPPDPFLNALRRTSAAASEDPIAFRVMRSLAADFLREDDAMPFELRKFALNVFTMERQLPTMMGRPRKDHHRDAVFCALIEELCTALGVTPTRNDASYDTTSACDILAAAMVELRRQPSSYAAVKQIWLNRERG